VYRLLTPSASDCQTRRASGGDPEHRGRCADDGQTDCTRSLQGQPTFEVGVDLGSPVSLDYFDRRPFAFDGKITTVEVQLKYYSVVTFPVR